jgi:hypothetical protein
MFVIFISGMAFAVSMSRKLLNRGPNREVDYGKRQFPKSGTELRGKSGNRKTGELNLNLAHLFYFARIILQHCIVLMHFFFCSFEKNLRLSWEI